MMDELWNHLRRAMREVLQHRDYRKAMWSEHEQILRAIATRDEIARQHWCARICATRRSVSR